MNQEVLVKVKTLRAGVAALALLALTTSAEARRDKGGIETTEGAYAAVAPLARALPDRRRTPGAIDPRVTPANIRQTICVSGYTKTVRPPQQYTHDLKVRQIRQYGDTDRRLRDYEEDHLIPLEIGGSPDSPMNLWPQPHHVIGNWGSQAKDKLENRLHHLVCHGQIKLAVAQRAVAVNWIDAYKRYVGPKPPSYR